jgi:hypothetical protein
MCVHEPRVWGGSASRSDLMGNAIASITLLRPALLSPQPDEREGRARGVAGGGGGGPVRRGPAYSRRSSRWCLWLQHGELQRKMRRERLEFCGKQAAFFGTCKLKGATVPHHGDTCRGDRSSCCEPCMQAAPEPCGGDTGVTISLPICPFLRSNQLLYFQWQVERYSARNTHCNDAGSK